MRNVFDLTEIEYGFPVSSQILQNALNFRRRNWICLSDSHTRYRALKLWLPHILIPEVLLLLPSYVVCIFSLFQVTISIPYFCVIFLFLLNPVSFFFSLSLSQDTSIGDCGDFDSEIDSRGSSAFPTPLQVTVCRLHTTQRLGCALISDVCSGTYSGVCFGEVEIEWQNERRSRLKFSGHYSCKYQGCT
jgi:hypothetical protein